MDFLAFGEFSIFFMRERFHDSAHVQESKSFFLPFHAKANTQVSSFNCTVNEPIRSE